jgi:hypothetical protein
MSFRMIKTACLTLALTATAAFAGPWATPSGTQATFDYSSGSDLMGHFGSGYGLPGGFQFFPDTLEAAASNNHHAQTGDTLSVVLNAKPNYMFTKVTGGMLGDLSGLGCTYFGGMGQLRVTNLDTSYVLWSNLNFDTLPLENGTMVASNWQGGTLLNLPAGWTNILIQMDGQVATYGDNGSTAFIETKGASIGVETAAIPLPPAVLAAIPAAFIAYRARRRSTKA